RAARIRPSFICSPRGFAVGGTEPSRLAGPRPRPTLGPGSAISALASGHSWAKIRTESVEIAATAKVAAERMLSRVYDFITAIRDSARNRGHPVLSTHANPKAGRNTGRGTPRNGLS